MSRPWPKVKRGEVLRHWKEFITMKPTQYGPRAEAERKPHEVRGALIHCTLRCRMFLTAAFTAGIGIKIAGIPSW